MSSISPVTVDRLQRATTLKIERITRKWAGLRSFVDDQVPVVGYAPDLEGFFWCAGQGGYGIETSYGMGRVSAALASGKSLPEDIDALGSDAWRSRSAAFVVTPALAYSDCRQRFIMASIPAWRGSSRRAASRCSHALWVSPTFSRTVAKVMCARA